MGKGSGLAFCRSTTTPNRLLGYAKFSSRRLPRDGDIGVREVVTLEEQRQIPDLGQRIAEQVGVVQPSRMAAAFAIDNEGGERGAQLGLAG